MGLRNFFKSLAQKETMLPDYFKIPDANTGYQANPGNAFTLMEHYFTVTLNEMYLDTERKWWTAHEPMVFSITEYNYGVQRVETPAVVGTDSIKAKMKNTPRGMIFQDVRLAGINPYSGGPVVINIALYRSQTANYLTSSLNFLEKLAGIFQSNMAAVIKNVVKISGVIIEGIDALVDNKTVDPVFGWSLHLDPDGGPGAAAITPGYYVMIGKSAHNWEPHHFYVKNNKLFYGQDSNSAVEFREGDYILFSLNQQPERNDYQLLPVYQSYQKIVDFAAQFDEISDDDKKKIGAMMRALNFEMMKSPDIIPAQGKKLMDKFYNDLKESVEKKYNFGARGAVKVADFWSDMDDKLASM